MVSCAWCCCRLPPLRDRLRVAPKARLKKDPPLSECLYKMEDAVNMRESDLMSFQKQAVEAYDALEPSAAKINSPTHLKAVTQREGPRSDAPHRPTTKTKRPNHRTAKGKKNGSS